MSHGDGGLLIGSAETSEKKNATPGPMRSARVPWNDRRGRDQANQEDTSCDVLFLKTNISRPSDSRTAGRAEPICLRVSYSERRELV